MNIEELEPFKDMLYMSIEKAMEALARVPADVRLMWQELPQTDAMVLNGLWRSIVTRMAEDVDEMEVVKGSQGQFYLQVPGIQIRMRKLNEGGSFYYNTTTSARDAVPSGQLTLWSDLGDEGHLAGDTSKKNGEERRLILGYRLDDVGLLAEVSVSEHSLPDKQNPYEPNLSEVRWSSVLEAPAPVQPVALPIPEVIEPPKPRTRIARRTNPHTPKQESGDE